MSTRALRKLQREQELQKQLAEAKDADEEVEESEDEEDEIMHTTKGTTKPLNAFDMLNDVEEDEVSDNEGDITTAVIPATTHPKVRDSTPSQSLKSKKKKKKPKKKAKPKPTDQDGTKEESGDEIDRALKEISAKNATTRLQKEEAEKSNWEAIATKLLAMEPKNLNPVNEMKSLFGNIAVEGQETRAPTRPQRRREQNQQGGVDLATALTGRYSVASRGKELGTFASRRNVFMQGKEDWPLATSGGLSMEYSPDAQSFERRYNIMHNNTYKETQMHFRMAVESMDPQRMIGLLTMNPYHIATLLQVSEIAKHQGDHSVSGDLLERALFSIGRSVHSSFPAALREGIARLDFQKPANRELYLTIWRYIRNLEMRGTWRTAFEWAKVLLQLDTLHDPYGITHMIDQLALRGRQHGQLIGLASEEAYGPAWKYLPNIQISLVLAYLRSGEPQLARRQLALAIHNYPYILCALASALDISPLPKTLWAKLPSTDAEKLFSELYVTRALDLWNTPETSQLIVEVAETLPHYSSFTASASPPPKLEISLEDARHIILLETPFLLALLPRRFTSMPSFSFDPLPPTNSIASDFTARAPGDASSTNAMQAIFNAAGATAGAAGSTLQRILNWFHAPAGPADTEGESEGQAALRDLQAQLGTDNVPPEMIEQLLRMHMHEADEEHDQHITAQDLGFGMAGDWDYYEEAANASSIPNDDDDDSLPELEEISVNTPALPRNPRAAMVEEALSDDENHSNHASSRPQNASRAVLRHADSEDSDIDETQAAASPPPIIPPSIRRPPENAIVGYGASQSQTPFQSHPATPETNIEDDPQRLQRWLLASGLTELQSNPSSLGTYVRRLKMLRKQQQDWVVNMVKQRAGVAVAERVKGALA